MWRDFFRLLSTDFVYLYLALLLLLMFYFIGFVFHITRKWLLFQYSEGAYPYTIAKMLIKSVRQICSSLHPSISILMDCVQTNGLISLLFKKKKKKKAKDLNDKISAFSAHLCRTVMKQVLLKHPSTVRKRIVQSGNFQVCCQTLRKFIRFI